MRVYCLIFSLCFLGLACDQPRVTVMPAEPEEETLSAPEVDPQERMRASVTVIAEQIREVWDPDKGFSEETYVHLNSEPGIYLGGGIILTNSSAKSETATPTLVQYENANGTTGEETATLLVDGYPGAVDFILMKTRQPPPIPPAILSGQLPGLKDKVWVRVRDCHGLVGSVNLMWGEYRFGIWLRDEDDCRCDMSEAVYDLEGRVLGVCNHNNRGPYWQPEGYERTLYGVLSSIELVKLLQKHHSVFE